MGMWMDPSFLLSTAAAAVLLLLLTTGMDMDGDVTVDVVLGDVIVVDVSVSLLLSI